jgi:hypothetical protein
MRAGRPGEDESPTDEGHQSNYPRREIEDRGARVEHRERLEVVPRHHAQEGEQASPR